MGHKDVYKLWMEKCLHVNNYKYCDGAKLGRYRPLRDNFNEVFKTGNYAKKCTTNSMGGKILLST
jgi:hypothetical protein